MVASRSNRTASAGKRRGVQTKCSVIGAPAERRPAYAEAKRKVSHEVRDHVRRQGEQQGEQEQVVAACTDRSSLLAYRTIGEVWNGPNRILFAPVSGPGSAPAARRHPKAHWAAGSYLIPASGEVPHGPRAAADPS